MNEVDDIREQVAKHTEERRKAWLQQERARYRKWMLIAATSAALVTVVAVLAKSLLFGVVALYLGLFAWNRWMEYERVRHWLSRPTPQNKQERVIWARIFYDEVYHPPLSLRVSYWIAGITAVVCVAFVFIVILAMSGFWTRLLFGIGYGLTSLFVAIWVLRWRRCVRDLKEHIKLSGEGWGDLT